MCLMCLCLILDSFETKKKKNVLPKDRPETSRLTTVFIDTS